MFMLKKGYPMINLPFMGKQILDIYKFYTLVVEHDGLVEVLNNYSLSNIAKKMKMRINSKDMQRIKVFYTDYLYPFEIEMEGFSTMSDLEKCTHIQYCSDEEEEQDIQDADNEEIEQQPEDVDESETSEVSQNKTHTIEFQSRIEKVLILS